MEKKFKEFISRARQIFEDTAESALSKILSSEHYRNIEEWYHEAFKKVSNFEKYIEEEKVSMMEIYNFVKQDMCSISMQMENFGAHIESLQNFKIDFSCLDIKNNIKTQIPQATKKNQILAARLTTYTSTWAVGPDKRDAISLYPVGGPIQLTAFGAFGFPDQNLLIHYKVYVEEKLVVEKKGAVIGLTDGKSPNKVDLPEPILLKENQIADIVVEYDKKDSIPYGKNGAQNHILSNKVNLCFRKSNSSNNGTDGKSGQIPFVCCILKS